MEEKVIADVGLIKAQSIQQYILSKIALNNCGVSNSRIRSLRKVEDRIEIEVKINDFNKDKVQKLQEVIKSEEIQFVIQTASSKQTFQMRDFDSKLFGSIGKYVLIRTQYFKKKVNLKFKQIFREEDDFQVQKPTHLQPQSFNSKKAIKNKGKMSFLLIKSKKQYHSSHAFISCNNIIRLGDFVYLNIRRLFEKKQISQFHDINSYLQYTKTLITQAADKGEIVKTILHINYLASFKIQIKFPDCPSLINFINKMHECSLNDCLQWDIPVCNNSIQNLNQLKSLLQCTRLNESANLNIIKRTFSIIPDWTSQILTYKQMNESILSEYFTSMAQKIRLQDVVTFQKYWNQLSTKFQDLLDNWNMEQYNSGKQLRELLKLLAFRIKKYEGKYTLATQTPNNGIGGKQKVFKLYEYLYPKIQFYVDQLTMRLKKALGNKNPREWQVNQKQEKFHILDKLLYNYFEEIDNFHNGRKQIEILVKSVPQQQKQQPLRSFLGKVFTYQSSAFEWEDVFNTITINLKLVIAQLSNTAQMEEQLKILDKYLPFEASPTNKCLSCMQYFYKNVSIPRRNNECVRLIPLSSKIKEYDTLIKDEICCLLNDNGGIILFDCMREYCSIYPYGAQTTLRQKQAYQNQINHLLNQIYPKPDTKNILVTFVPVILHPLRNKHLQRKMVRYTGQDQHLKPNQFHFCHVFADGVYVLRIKVCPTHKSTVFLWKNEEQVYHLYDYQKFQLKNPDAAGRLERTPDRLFKLKNLHKAIKIRYKKHLKQKKQKKKLFTPPTYITPLNHVCHPPLQGIQLSEITPQQKAHVEPHSSLDNQFQHMSMIVIRPRYLQTFKERLRSSGFKFSIEIKFQSYRFKVAANTAILYHNQSFNELLKVLSYNPNFMFQNRMTLAIYVTDYIRLENSQNERNRIKNHEVANISQWLKHQFPKESLQFFEFRRTGHNSQYFLKTDSKLSTVFIYYITNSFNIKTVFKNPQQLDKMTLEERQQQLTLIDYGLPVNAESKHWGLNNTDAAIIPGYI